MMKKMLTLLVVIALASVASATLQLSVNGDRGVEEVFLTGPSDIVIFDIWTSSQIAANAPTEGYFALVAATADGSIDASLATYTSGDNDLWIGNNAVTEGYIPLDPGIDGAWGWVFIFGTPIAAETTLFDNIVFHCNSEENVVVSLIKVNADWTLGDVYDTVLVHQIPEPMTIALLGLGGLLLRKRS